MEGLKRPRRAKAAADDVDVGEQAEAEAEEAAEAEEGGGRGGDSGETHSCIVCLNDFVDGDEVDTCPPPLSPALPHPFSFPFLLTFLLPLPPHPPPSAAGERCETGDGRPASPHIPPLPPPESLRRASLPGLATQGACLGLQPQESSGAGGARL